MPALVGATEQLATLDGPRPLLRERRLQLVEVAAFLHGARELLLALPAEQAHQPDLAEVHTDVVFEALEVAAVLIVRLVGLELVELSGRGLAAERCGPIRTKWS